MDYFQVGWHQDAELEALAFGACQLVVCSLDAVELAHLQLSRLQLVMRQLMESEYLMMLVIESQEANQPKLLQQFQLLERLFSQQLSLPVPFWQELHRLVD
jgi:hypothetical protein